MAKPNPRRRQAAASSILLSALPSQAREPMVKDHLFTTQLGVVPLFHVTIGRGYVVEAADLHTALRLAVDGAAAAVVKTREGSRLDMRLSVGKRGTVVLAHGEHLFSFADADLLATKKTVRLRALKRVFLERPLLAEEEAAWRRVASERPLEGLEYAELMSALTATPEAWRIRYSKPERFEGKDLLPKGRAYFERLVAPLGNAATIEDFVAQLLAAQSELLRRNSKRALRRIAFTALWQPLIPFSLLKDVAHNDIATLLKAEDPFSLLFGFELCAARLSEDPAFATLGTSFVKRLLLDKRSRSRCMVYSACAMICASRTRLAALALDAPLYWVRLAALSHAGVLADAMRRNLNAERFWQWALDSFYPAYHWHAEVDRREAPRWRPYWIEPGHVYADLVGRVANALGKIPRDQRPESWTSIFDQCFEALEAAGDLVAMSYPGPFEDYGPHPGSESHEFFVTLDAMLDLAPIIEKVGPLTALAYTTRPSDRLVHGMARILAGPVDAPIAPPGEETQALHLAAHVAAVTRSEGLAQDVIRRAVFEVRRAGRTAPLGEFLTMVLVACASTEDQDAFYRLFADAAVRLAYAIETLPDIAAMQDAIPDLGSRDENLITALSRAGAILEAKRGRAA